MNIGPLYAAGFTAGRVSADTELECLRLIHALRAEEGDEVTIFCDNPDPGASSKANAVQCCGEWTNWIDRRFDGDSLTEALKAAAEARRAYQQQAREKS